MVRTSSAELVVGRRGMGLRAKLLVTVSVLLAVVYGCVAFVLDARVRNFVEQTLIEKGTSLGASMARSGAPLIAAGSTEGLDDVLLPIRTDHDVLRAGIFAANGDLITVWPPGPWPLPRTTARDGTRLGAIDGEQVIEVRSPIDVTEQTWKQLARLGRTPASRPVGARGSAALILHRERERWATTDVLFHVLPVLIAGLAVALLGIFGVSRAFLAPVSDVTEALRGVSRGEFDGKVDADTRDEAGELGAVTNQVMHDLRRFRLVNEHRRNLLQKRVERRTAELQEMKRYLESVIQNTSEGIITLDIAGHVVRLNQAASKVLGQTAEAVLGRSVAIFADVDLQDLMRHFRAGGESTKIVLGVSPKTHGRRLVVTFSPILGLDGKPEGLTAILVDRTAENLAMERIVQANERLRHLDRMKDAFISSVSHEFRTPLASIKAFVEILLLYPEEREQNMDEFLGIIDSEVDRLSDMVESLLDLSKLRAGAAELTRAPVDPLVLVREAGRRLQPLLSQRSLKLVVEPSHEHVLMLGDRDRLLQVLLNLVGNARKFAPTDGKILIRWRAFPEEVEIEVSDDGPGVPQEKINELFERFRQVSDHLTDRPAGTGLGLAISKEIVLAHNGSIRAFRSELGGLGIAFRLPRVMGGAIGASALATAGLTEP